jgi:hypothetical protein
MISEEREKSRKALFAAYSDPPASIDATMKKLLREGTISLDQVRGIRDRVHDHVKQLLMDEKVER